MYTDLDGTGFRTARKEAGRILGREIWPAHSYVKYDYDLPHCADIKLKGLARQLTEAENAVGQNPHVNDLYIARDQARREFGRVHKLFLNLGLVDGDWTRYFKE